MMFKAPRLRSFVRPLLVTAALAGAASTQASHSWGGYHWARTSNPFTLKLGDNVSSAWDAHLQDASSDWSASAVLNTTVVAGGSPHRNCKPTAGRTEVCNASYGNNGWLGLAQIWITGGTHITQGAAKMNDYYFNQPQYNTASWRQLVMCQEVAHTFGLDHQDTNFDNPNLGTCMDYTGNPDGPPSNTSPNAHDFEELQIIYAHLDSTNTVGQTTNPFSPAMNDLDFDNPRNWGRLVKSGNGGRTQTFEQDFGRGDKVVTFVIWADGEARGNRGQ
jgi:hypothetical protein